MRRRDLFRHIALASVLFAAPALAAPPAPDFKLFDTHAHFVTSDVAHYPLHAEKAYEGEAKLTARIMADPTPAERILKTWDANGVGGGVGVQYHSAYQFDDRYLLDMARRYPQRMVPVVIFDTLDPATPAHLRAAAASAGAVGIRMTGFADKTGAFPWLDSDVALRTWAVADALKLAVVLMPLPPGQSAAALRHVARIAERYPHVRIVLDHVAWPDPVGAPGFGLSPEHLALTHYRNVYYKWSTINLENLKAKGISSSDYLRHLVDVFGADHIMWGSDFGNTPLPYAEMVREALGSTTRLTALERRAVLSDTGRAVFVRRS